MLKISESEASVDSEESEGKDWSDLEEEAQRGMLFLKCYLLLEKRTAFLAFIFFSAVFFTLLRFPNVASSLLLLEFEVYQDSYSADRARDRGEEERMQKSVHKRKVTSKGRGPSPKRRK